MSVTSHRRQVEVCYCRICGSVWREATHPREEVVPGFYGSKLYPCEFCRATGRRVTVFHVEHYTTIHESVIRAPSTPEGEAP